MSDDTQLYSHLRRRAINPGSEDDFDAADSSPLISVLQEEIKQDHLPRIVSYQQSVQDVSPLVTTLQQSGEDISPLIITLKKSGEDVAPIVGNLRKAGEDVSHVISALQKSGEDVSPLTETLYKYKAVPARKFEPRKREVPNLYNVQGDICFIFPKRWEGFLFFKIRANKVKEFRESLLKYHPRITSAAQTREDINKNVKHHEVISSGIAFSKAGLKVLGIMEDLKDPHFDGGSQYHEAKALGDNYPENYESPFNGPEKTDGVILVATQKEATCKKELEDIQKIFGDSIDVVAISEGRVRERGAEHFGWKDGISQPALQGITKKPWPGQRVVKPGALIFGYPGDPLYQAKDPRPSFTKDGSFMVFRKLEQNVLFLDYYIEKNWRSQVPLYPEPDVKLSDEERKKLFGARLFGRFQSGVPLALSPYKEDKAYEGADKNNNFNYKERLPQYGCPLAAHVRKTAPRDLNPFVTDAFLDSSVIVRAGIPYGKEISQKERDDFEKLDEHDKEYLKCERGLSFVCYQSSIHNGFFRQATLFGNNDWFPTTGLLPNKIGQDPIIGGPPEVHHAMGQTDLTKEGAVTLDVLSQSKTGEAAVFEVTGVAKKKDTSATAFVQKYFVTSRGGEYYFVPSRTIVRKWAEAK